MCQGLDKPLYVSQELRRPLGATFLDDIRNAETILNCIGVLICPELFSIGSRAIQKLNQGQALYAQHNNVSLWPSFFSGIEVISNRTTLPHRDPHAASTHYDFLISAGRHEEAWLELLDIKVKLSYQPCTVVAICGKVLCHAVPD